MGDNAVDIQVRACFDSMAGSTPVLFNVELQYHLGTTYSGWQEYTNKQAYDVLFDAFAQQAPVSEINTKGRAAFGSTWWDTWIISADARAAVGAVLAKVGK